MAETEAVSRKKRIHAGHWGSVTKTISQVYEALLDSEANSSKLGQQRLTFAEKHFEIQWGCNQLDYLLGLI